MKNLFSSTALTVALAAVATTMPSSGEAGILDKITREIGRAATDVYHGTEDAAEDVADVVEGAGRIVDDKIIQPVRQVGESVAEGVVEATEGVLGVVSTVSLADLLHDLLIQGDSVSTAFSEMGEDFNKAVTKLVDAPLYTVTGVGEGVAELTDNLAGEVIGDGVRVVALVSGVTVALPKAMVDGMLHVSEGNDAADVVGIPLATALLQAEAFYDGKGTSLDAQTKALLTPHFDAELLESIRLVVSDDIATVPGVINAVQSQFGNSKDGNHAVTVGNVIVFDRAPNPLQDFYFIAHEVAHVAQYAESGVIGFAARYTLDPNEVEQEAHESALEAMSKLRTLLAALGLDLESS